MSAFGGSVINASLKLTLSLALAIWISACAAGDQKKDQLSVKNTQVIEGTSWWVEDINGRGVIDMSHTTIEFSQDGRVSGDTGCNRYFGTYETKVGQGSGGPISFGPLAGTRKACAESLMNQESDFYQAMDRVRLWEIADTGLLYLSDDQGKRLLTAFRTEE